MARLDRRGLPLSTTSDLAADPNFALAHAARARLHAIRAEPVQARTLLDRRLHRRPAPRGAHWQSLLAN